MNAHGTPHPAHTAPQARAPRGRRAAALLEVAGLVLLLVLALLLDRAMRASLQVDVGRSGDVGYVAEGFYGRERTPAMPTAAGSTMAALLTPPPPLTLALLGAYAAAWLAGLAGGWRLLPPAGSALVGLLAWSVRPARAPHLAAALAVAAAVVVLGAALSGGTYLLLRRWLRLERPCPEVPDG